MARLPSGRYLIQQIGPEVILFEEYTEREIVRFDPNNADSIAAGLTAITNADISVEDATYALFWSGYFYAYVKMDAPLVGIEELTLEYMRGKVLRMGDKIAASEAPHFSGEGRFIPQGATGGRLTSKKPLFKENERKSADG